MLCVCGKVAPAADRECAGSKRAGKNTRTNSPHSLHSPTHTQQKLGVGVVEAARGPQPLGKWYLYSLYYAAVTVGGLG